MRSCSHGLFPGFKPDEAALKQPPRQCKTHGHGHGHGTGMGMQRGHMDELRFIRAAAAGYFPLFVSIPASAL